MFKKYYRIKRINYVIIERSECENGCIHSQMQVNNNCATGSSALILAKQLIQGGMVMIFNHFCTF